MEREALHDFVVISETLSFSEAAEKLYISQSSLSKRIRALEKELGETLFVRNTRSMQLSEFGIAFLPYAKQILTGYESADMFLEQYRTVNARSVILGSIRNPQCFGIDRIFTAFQKQYPDIRMELVEGRLEELANLFRIGKISLYCTCSAMRQEEQSGFIAVGKGRLAAVLRDDDPLLEKNIITPEDLKGRSLLMPGEHDSLFDLVNDRFHELGIAPDIVYKGGAISSISLVKSGLGIAIQPIEIAKAYLAEHTVLADIEPEISYEFGLGYRDKRKMSRAEILFVEFLEEHFGMKEYGE